MNVRLPLWLEHPSNPRCRYQRWNRLTIAWGEVASALSVQITWGPACGTVWRYSTRAILSSSLIGIIRPDFPLLAESRRQMARPISPWESLVIHQVSRAISLALKPALADRRNITRFRAACLVLAK